MCASQLLTPCGLGRCRAKQVTICSCTRVTFTSVDRQGNIMHKQCVKHECFHGQRHCYLLCEAWALGMHAGAAPCMRPCVRILLENTETLAHVVVIWNESCVLSCCGCDMICVQSVSLNCPRPVRFSTISDDLLNLCDSSEQPDPYT